MIVLGHVSSWMSVARGHTAPALAILGSATVLAILTTLVLAVPSIGATYPPHLSRRSGPPGVLVELGPQPSGPLAGVPMAADCPQPNASIVRRASEYAEPGDPASGLRLAGTFGETSRGWLTFRFRVPRVDPGWYDIVLWCADFESASTSAADGPAFRVLPELPGTSTEAGAAPASRWVDPLVVSALLGALVGGFMAALRRGRPRTSRS
jgi:hypothetical protein